MCRRSWELLDSLLRVSGHPDRVAQARVCASARAGAAGEREGAGLRPIATKVIPDRGPPSLSTCDHERDRRAVRDVGNHAGQTSYRRNQGGGVMKSGKPRRLTKLRINEISLVDRGAGRGVHIALAKRDSHPGPVKEATVKYLKKIMKSLNRAVVDSGEILPPCTREQLYETVVKTACTEVDAQPAAI